MIINISKDKDFFQLKYSITMLSKVQSSSFVGNKIAIKSLNKKFKCKKGIFVSKNIYPSENTSQRRVREDSILDKYTLNLSHKARNGSFSEIVGRDKELTKLKQILVKRKKSNPILIGEAGVGKTAIVEELARLINNFSNEENDNDYEIEHFKDYEILQLDVTSIMSNTAMRGELEKHLTDLIDVLKNRNNLILFIDEIHSLVDRTSGNGSKMTRTPLTENLMEMFKIPLGRGEITIIGATTYDEYVKYFEPDEAINRRFNPIYIDEPSESETIEMIHKVKGMYEEHHDCKITSEAISKAVYLSGKYIYNRRFPDKAIDIIDEASSMIRMKHFYDKEKYLPKIVDVQDVEKVISLIYDIDVKSLNNLENIQNNIDKMEKVFKQNIIGQDEAINDIMNVLRRNTCEINDPSRPISTLLFVGPNGVGKTKFATLIPNQFYGGGNKHLITFNMAEYIEEYSISSLIGSPAGYIGYEEGGLLFKSIKHNSCSVIVFDNIDKAHPKILNILLQILEDGVLTDALKKKYSFKNNIIIMTTSVNYKESNLEFETINTYENKTNDTKSIEMKYSLTNTFKPEFLNRIDKIIEFKYLEETYLEELCKKLIHQEITKIKSSHKLSVKLSEKTYNEIMSEVKCEGRKNGARPIIRIITKYITDPVVIQLLRYDLEDIISMTKNNIILV